MSSNEAYLRTSKQLDNYGNAAVGEFLRRHHNYICNILPTRVENCNLNQVSKMLKIALAIQSAYVLHR